MGLLRREDVIEVRITLAMDAVCRVGDGGWKAKRLGSCEGMCCLFLFLFVLIYIYIYI